MTAATLRVRVVAAGEVRADDHIDDRMTEEQLEAVSAAHELVARDWLAQGVEVELESRNLDGSLFALVVLAPRPDLPDGFEVAYAQEFSP